MSVSSELKAAIQLMPRAPLDRVKIIVAHRDMFAAIQESFEARLSEGLAVMAQPPVFDLKLRESTVLPAGWAICLDKDGKPLFTIRPDSAESQAELTALSESAGDG